MPIPHARATTAAAAPCRRTARLTHACMHAKPCSTCQTALLHCKCNLCMVHCCRYADEEGVSDDEDMLRAFWSEDDEGTPCLCLCSAWLPACACLPAGMAQAGWRLG